MSDSKLHLMSFAPVPDTGSVQPSGLKTADDHCGQNNLYKTRINADVKSIGRQKK